MHSYLPVALGRKCTVPRRIFKFYHLYPATIELSFNSMGLHVGSRSPLISISCFAYKLDNSSTLVVHAWR